MSRFPESVYNEIKERSLSVFYKDDFDHKAFPIDDYMNSMKKIHERPGKTYASIVRDLIAIKRQANEFHKEYDNHTHEKWAMGPMQALSAARRLRRSFYTVKPLLHFISLPKSEKYKLLKEDPANV